MKQHITAGMYSELTLDARTKLIKWCLDREYFIPAISNEEVKKLRGVVCRMSDPLLSIGQMIEFLGTRCLISYPRDQWHVCVCGDVIPVVNLSGEVLNKDEYDSKHYYADTLRDVLWKAVKGELNETSIN